MGTAVTASKTAVLSIKVSARAKLIFLLELNCAIFTDFLSAGIRLAGERTAFSLGKTLEYEKQEIN